MFSNYIKITFRSLAKNKIFVIINVLGMGVALACCIIAYLNYEYAMGFDSNQENIEKVYRIGFERTFENETRKYGFVPMALGTFMKSNESEPEVIRYHSSGVTIRIGDDLFGSNIKYVDENFFDVFTFPLLYGNKEDLKDPSKVFISFNMSRRVFGDQDPIGKEIIQVLDSTTRLYTIAGVVDQIQDNSSFGGFQMITHWDNLKSTWPEINENDWTGFTTVFLVIENPKEISNLESQLKQFIEPQNLAREDFKITRYYVESMKGMAFRSRKNNVSAFLRRGIPIPAVYVPPIMAFLILLIACFNFTNTSIASSNNWLKEIGVRIRRTKEIGVRKVLGASVLSIIINLSKQFVIILLVSAVLGAVLGTYFGDELMSSVFTYHIAMNILPGVLSVFLMMIFSISIIGYKIFSAASANPVKTLRVE